jgi:hypothetical protein
MSKRTELIKNSQIEIKTGRDETGSFVKTTIKKSYYFESRDFMFAIRVSDHPKKHGYEPDCYDHILDLVISETDTIESITDQVITFLRKAYRALYTSNDIDFGSFAHLDFEKCANDFGVNFFV